MTRAAILAASVLVLLPALGCGGGLAASDPSSPTRGLSLELRVRDAGYSLALYRVDQDGTIAFGGGMDAFNERTSWSDEMTADEIDALHELLNAHGWFERKPAGEGRPDALIHDARIDWPGGSRRFRTIGRAPDVEPVRDHLERICQRRLEPYLESLPKPGERGR